MRPDAWNGKYAELKANSFDFIKSLCGEFQKHNNIDPSYYRNLDVKRGLRNADGTGVMAGLTRIGNVRGYYMQDGEKMPAEGHLFYRGIDVEDLIRGFTAEGRFGYEETAYLLLFGALPTREQLLEFRQGLMAYRSLPANFTEDMILKAPSDSLMNKLGRSVLALYSYDPDPNNNTMEVELTQALALVARFPTIVAHAYAVKRHYYNNESLYLHRPQDDLSVAENFLYSIRPDNQFTPQEAKVLDLCMVLHAEHGGGNNSAFACRVLSSSDTDIYSAISAAVGALKGPRHGGANKKVGEMVDHIKANVQNWEDEVEMSAYLNRILRKEVGDQSGLIYGMGHAIYTLSDPRARLLKEFAASLAVEKGMEREFNLLQMIEKLTPDLMNHRKGTNKPVCANVDLYSGLVYEMLGIAKELYTPLFAMARVVGWCAHRMEEVCNKGNKIIRPAYKAVSPRQKFVPLDERVIGEAD